jgi:Tol biopolymer transport system component
MSDEPRNDNQNSPDPAGNEDRIADALNAYGDTVEPADAWVGIAARLDERRSPWAFVTGNPLAAGLLGVVVLLAAVVAVSALRTGGDGGGTPDNLDLIDEGEDGDPAGRLAAGTPEGALVELALRTTTGTGADGQETHETDVVETSIVAAGNWAEAQRPDGTPEDEGLLTEIVATNDGLTVLQTRPEHARSATCGEDELWTSWDIWRVELGGDQLPVPLFEGDAAPSRLPALSADGKWMAHLTTSNSERCDAALTVAVSSFDTGEVAATHNLPVGAVPDQLYWSPDGALYVLLPQPNDELVAVLPVRVNNPETVSGPIDFSGASFSSLASLLVTADRQGESLSTSSTELGSDSGGDAEFQVWQGVFGSDVIGAGRLYYDVPVTGVADAPTSLTADGAGGSWITVDRGTPSTPVADWDRYELYARRFASAELIGTGYLAVASLDNAGESTEIEPGPPPVIDADGERNPLQPQDWRDVSGFAYVTPAGDIYQHAIFGAEPRLLASLDFGADDFVSIAGLALSPDEQMLYLSQWFSDGGGCDSTLWSIDYPAAGVVPAAALVDVGQGIYPAVSPDGSKLAYFAIEPGPGGAVGCSFDLVVEDLASGERTVWDGDPVFAPREGWIPSPQGTVWGPDSRTLAFSAVYEGALAYTFDTGSPEGDLTATELDLPAPDDGTFWQVAGHLDTREVVVTSGCYAVCENTTRTLVAVDPADPTVTRVLARLDASAVAPAVDHDGTNIAYIERSCAASSCSSVLLWTDGGAAPVQVATAVDVFAWVP